MEAGYHVPYLGGRNSVWISGREPELSGLRSSADPLIVLVEDESMLITLITMMLDLLDYNNVVSFLSGDGVLEYCRAKHPRLLITDIRHAGPDGLELCRMIRKDPVLADMPLMVVSAFYADEIAEILEELRVVYLLKPCDFDELSRYIEEMTGRRRAAI